MQVKRYVAPNMRLALKRVREEVGPDAVILSSKRLDDGVEVMTAVEGQPSAAVRAPAFDTSPAFDTNPFKDDGPARNSTNKPSKLESELEQIQRANQQRARALVESLARQSAQANDDNKQADAAPTEQAAVYAQASPDKSAAANVAAVADVVADVVELKGAATPSAVEGEVAQMRVELQSMRDLLEQQLSSIAWGQFRQQHPQQASLWRRMKRMGLSAEVANQLLERLPEEGSAAVKDIWQFLMVKLGQRLPVDATDLVAQGGVFALVGPTGAGKTTTIGKLATRYVLEHGPEQVALVTTDTARIAAHEQLRTFGRILNVPVKVVDKNNSLERVLYSLRHKALVLIDTAGLNRNDERLKEQLQSLSEMSGRVKTLLTMPATSQEAVIRATYHAYQADNLTACILTKMDEAASVGEVLSLAVEKQLPIAYSTNGQGVPDDITVADSKGLIRVAIELAKQVSTDDGAMAEEMASLARG